MLPLDIRARGRRMQFAQLKRREFIAGLGASAAAWPRGAWAQAQQRERMRRIGVLMPFPTDEAEALARVTAFTQALTQLGWTVGQNVRIDYRWGPGNAETMREHAAELVALAPDVVLASGSAAVAPLLEASRAVPIVFASVAGPVAAGYVESLERPGGNATGFTVFEYSISGKWLELLKEVAPRVTRVAMLFNPAVAPYAESFLNPFKAAASSFAVKAIAAPVRDLSELESVVAAQAREPNGGLIVMPDTFTDIHRAEITSLAARSGLPAVYPRRIFTEVGGLLSYGIDQLDSYRRAAIYVDRILKGEKPSELPVQAPVKFELVINLKTAKALGLEVPWFLRQRADEVIE